MDLILTGRVVIVSLVLPNHWVFLATVIVHTALYFWNMINPKHYSSSSAQSKENQHRRKERPGSQPHMTFQGRIGNLPSTKQNQSEYLQIIVSLNR